MDPQNQTPQPNFTPQNTPPPPPIEPPTQPEHTMPSEQRKSSGLAITSLVLSIVGLLTTWILGLGILLAVLAAIFGIVALAKNQGGKGMSIAGIIIGGINILIGVFILTIGLVSYNGIQDRAVSTQNESSARKLQKKAELYNIQMGSYDRNNYPTYEELVASDSTSIKLDSETLNLIHGGNESSVSAGRPIAYEGCSYGASIYYYDAAAKNVESIIVGEPSRC